MLSRVVETLYWTGRYIERAEDIARLIDVNNHLLLDLPKGVSTGWEPLIDIIGGREQFLQNYSDFQERKALKFLITQEQSPSSILSSLWSARENARTVRDILPPEVWQGLNALYHYAKDNQQEGINKRGRASYLENIIRQTQGIQGTLAGTMNHDSGYQFAYMGQLIERADMTSRIIDVRSTNLLSIDDSSFDKIQWVSVLHSLSAHQTYRQDRGVQVRRPDILNFLFKSETFPRSVLFCLNEVKATLQKQPNSEGCIDAVNYACHRLHDVSAEGLRHSDLQQFVDDLQVDIARLHNVIAANYFLPVLMAQEQNSA